ncbi:ribonuclease HII [Flexibacterium corallicola]|uniref:ribonuclease HII n=1 Tax=Flexibacterium corallicola TaxID=3037259 RepID=UPI00286FAD2F|nr:ribonuclease HII [Pseudovibrio sp. M1P-2-3]
MTYKIPSLFDIPFPDTPDVNFERDLVQKLNGPIIGVDEAGRGPWAGPVVVAAASLNYDRLPDGLNDSKKLSQAKREGLYQQILENAVVSVCIQSAQTIDKMNIRAATLDGMAQVATSLPQKAKITFFDGRDIPPTFNENAQALVKGDGRCLAISAASIIAKVVRDRLMVQLEDEAPGYGFAKHKGYGTKEHQEALERLGASPFHRRSFRPIRERLQKEA